MSKRGIMARKQVEELLVRHNRDISVFRIIENAIAKSLDLQETLPNILLAAIEALQAGGGGVYLLEHDGETMVLSVHHGEELRTITSTPLYCVGGLSARRPPGFSLGVPGFAVSDIGHWPCFP